MSSTSLRPNPKVAFGGENGLLINSTQRAGAMPARLVQSPVRFSKSSPLRLHLTFDFGILSMELINFLVLNLKHLGKYLATFIFSK